MSKIFVDTIEGNTGTTIAFNSKINPSTGLTGNVSTGLVRLGSTEWTTNTSYVDFDVIDTTKYTNYLILGYVDPADSTGTKSANNLGWFVSGMRIKVSGSVKSDAYYPNGLFYSAASGAGGNNGEGLAVNQDPGAGNTETYWWLCGNGTNYFHSFQTFFTCPNYNGGSPMHRTIATLGMPDTGDSAYHESSAGSYRANQVNATQVDGIRIFGVGTGGSSNALYGSIQIYGYEK